MYHTPPHEGVTELQAGGEALSGFCRASHFTDLYELKIAYSSYILLKHEVWPYFPILYIRWIENLFVILQPENALVVTVL